MNYLQFLFLEFCSFPSQFSYYVSFFFEIGAPIDALLAPTAFDTASAWPREPIGKVVDDVRDDVDGAAGSEIASPSACEEDDERDDTQCATDAALEVGFMNLMTGATAPFEEALVAEELELRTLRLESRRQ